MKTFNIHLLNQHWLIEGTVEAKSAIEALKKWYSHMNTTAGAFKNFQYETKEVQTGDNYFNGKMQLSTKL